MDCHEVPKLHPTRKETQWTEPRGLCTRSDWWFAYSYFNTLWTALFGTDNFHVAIATRLWKFALDTYLRRSYRRKNSCPASCIYVLIIRINLERLEIYTDFFAIFLSHNQPLLAVCRIAMTGKTIAMCWLMELRSSSSVMSLFIKYLFIFCS